MTFPKRNQPWELEEPEGGAVEDEKELTRQRGCWLCGGGREDQDRHSRPRARGGADSGWRGLKGVQDDVSGAEAGARL